MTRFVRKLDLAFEIRDLVKLHWALNFLRSKGDFQRRHDRSTRLRSRLATRISGLIHSVWGLRTTVLDLSGAWMSSMELRVEDSCSDRSDELEAGLVRKRGCQILNYQCFFLFFYQCCFEGAVLNDSVLSCRANV